jgi:hypothetical protein
VDKIVKEPPAHCLSHPSGLKVHRFGFVAARPPSNSYRGLIACGSALGREQADIGDFALVSGRPCVLAGQSHALGARATGTTKDVPANGGGMLFAA